MKTFTCDRCRKYLRDEFNDNHPLRMRDDYVGNRRLAERPYDLCFDCWKAVCLFLEPQP